MNSCLIEHSYNAGMLLKEHHPLLGAAMLIFLLLLLFKLPGKILGFLFGALRAGLRTIWLFVRTIVGALLKAPFAALRALFSGGPKRDLRSFARFGNPSSPYYYDINAKPPPKPSPPRKRTSWRDVTMYMAVTLIFMLILDDYYNNCAVLDKVLNFIPQD